MIVIDAKLRALAHPTRLKILTCLTQSDKSAGELVKHCHLSQSAVSQHLSLLYQAGLVTVRKQGRQRIYSLSDSVSGQISQQLLDYLQIK